MRNDDSSKAINREVKHVAYDAQKHVITKVRGVAMKEEKGNDKYLLSSVYNALEILDLLSQRENIGVAEISKALGMGKSSVFRLLYTLETKGYVVKNESAKYMLGRKLAFFGEIIQSRQDEYSIARPELEALRDRTGETTHLSVLLPNLDVMFVEKVKSNIYSIMMTSRMGYEFPAYGSGTGKMLMSALLGTDKETEIDRIKLKRFTRNTIATMEELKAELRKIREQGYSIDNEESEDGLYCISVPVYNSDGSWFFLYF